MATQPSESALKKLRAHYDRDRAIRNAIDTVTGLYDGGANWLAAVDADVYRTDRMAPKDRERVLIGLFTANAERSALAIHAYWGLMEGMSPEEVQQTVLLAATYSGLNRYTFGLGALRATFAELEECAELDDPNDEVVADRLVHLWPEGFTPTRHDGFPPVG